jgi:hypothetical protein
VIEKEVVAPPTANQADGAPVKHSWPPLFALLELQFGAGVGFLQTAVPFWLAKEGLPLDGIATVSAVANSPHAWKLFWVPLVDLGPWRRIWYSVFTLGTAALVVACSALDEPSRHLSTYTLLLFGLQVACSTAHAAVNGLMASTTRLEDKGRTAGWQMAGNVGSTSLLGTLPIWLGEVWSRRAAGLLLAGIIIAGGVAVLWVAERAEQPWTGSFLRAAGRRVKESALDLFHTAFSRTGAVVLVLCLAPVSCGALTNLFSAMAGDFHASERAIAVINGPGMSAAGAVGSLIGGYAADRINKRLNYFIWGGATGTCALLLALVPFNPTTYAVATLAYSLANGCAFAAFAAMVLEVVTGGAAVTTKYTLFVSASNLAISYTTQLDGAASNWKALAGGGVRGTVLFDALITYAGIGLVLVLLFTVLRRRPPAEPAPAST